MQRLRCMRQCSCKALWWVVDQRISTAHNRILGQFLLSHCRLFMVILRAWTLATTARASPSNLSTSSTPVSSRTSSRGPSTTGYSRTLSSRGRRQKPTLSMWPSTLTGLWISGTRCPWRRAKDRSWTAVHLGPQTVEVKIIKRRLSWLGVFSCIWVAEKRDVAALNGRFLNEFIRDISTVNPQHF